jgi:hypothetical protein
VIVGGGANVGLTVGTSVGSDVPVGAGTVGGSSVDVGGAVVFVAETCVETDVQDVKANSKSMRIKKYLVGTENSL